MLKWETMFSDLSVKWVERELKVALKGVSVGLVHYQAVFRPFKDLRYID